MTLVGIGHSRRTLTLISGNLFVPNTMFQKRNLCLSEAAFFLLQIQFMLTLARTNLKCSACSSRVGLAWNGVRLCQAGQCIGPSLHEKTWWKPSLPVRTSWGEDGAAYLPCMNYIFWRPLRQLHSPCCWGKSKGKSLLSRWKRWHYARWRRAVGQWERERKLR